MIRLAIRSQTPEEAVVEVDGWISRKNVSILKQEGARLLGETQRLVLDLEEVPFIDEMGIALLQGWSGERLVLRNGLPFVQLLLEKHGLA